MIDLDTALGRATEIFLGDRPNETDAELESLLPPRIAAGYVAVDGESDSGDFWRFTSRGVERQKTLGLLA